MAETYILHTHLYLIDCVSPKDVRYMYVVSHQHERALWGRLPALQRSVLDSSCLKHFDLHPTTYTFVEILSHIIYINFSVQV